MAPIQRTTNTGRVLTLVEGGGCERPDSFKEVKQAFSEVLRDLEAGMIKDVCILGNPASGWDAGVYNTVADVGELSLLSGSLRDFIDMARRGVPEQ